MRTQKYRTWGLALALFFGLTACAQEGASGQAEAGSSSNVAATSARSMWRDQDMKDYQKPADDSGPIETILLNETAQVPASWSADGNTLAFCELSRTTGLDIWMLSQGEEQPRPFATSLSNESMLTFSPDGRWKAYVSDNTGQNEVYVVPHPGEGRGTPVSAGGGTEPVWSEDGKTLYFRNGRRLMSVSTGEDPNAFRSPELVLEVDFPRGRFFANYDVLPDGRFVIPQPVDAGGPAPIHAVLDWFTELRERLPGK